VLLQKSSCFQLLLFKTVALQTNNQRRIGRLRVRGLLK